MHDYVSKMFQLWKHFPEFSAFFPEDFKEQKSSIKLPYLYFTSVSERLMPHLMLLTSSPIQLKFPQYRPTGPSPGIVESYDHKSFGA